MKRSEEPSSVLAKGVAFMTPMLGILLVIGAWQLGTWLLRNPQVLPGPAATAAAAWHLITDGSLLKYTWTSLSRVIQGWLLAVVIAIPLGGAMGRIPVVRKIVQPVIEVIRPIPPIAVIPIAILWFGIGWTAQLFIVFYGAFFPMVIGVYDAFRRVDTLYEQAARCLGCHGLKLFRRVIVMAALPGVISALRIGLGLAFVSLVAAELIAASSGLGFLISNSRSMFQTDYILVGMITIGLVGFLLGWLMNKAERYAVRWT
jgi:ABC-type nitrate/sulfonate/bicarbonate transport system permease component